MNTIFTMITFMFRLLIPETHTDEYQSKRFWIYVGLNHSLNLSPVFFF